MGKLEKKWKDWKIYIVPLDKYIDFAMARLELEAWLEIDANHSLFLCDNPACKQHFKNHGLEEYFNPGSITVVRTWLS